MILPFLVDAKPDRAYSRSFDALVDVNARCSRFVQTKSLVAGAHEAPEGVGTVAVLAEILVFLAFVDVFQDDLSMKTFRLCEEEEEEDEVALRLTVTSLGLYPFPPGQSSWYSGESLPGQRSQ